MKQYIKDGVVKTRNNIVLRVTKEINGTYDYAFITSDGRIQCEYDNI